MSAVVFALLIVTASISIQEGTYDAMEAYSVRSFTGEIQIHRRGFYDERTLEYSLRIDDQDWDAVLERQSWVESSSRRLSGFGLISSDSSSTGAIIVGVQPEAERALTSFSRRPAAGLLLSTADPHGILIGEVLARNLQVTTGDTVVVLTQGYRNQLGAELYHVRGLLRTGSPDVDRVMMIMSLEDAQELFSMPDRFTEIVLNTDDLRKAEARARDLENQLTEADVEVMAWPALLPELKQARALDDAGNMFFYVFLLILVGFEIFNTASMSVMERVREFGILQSIGMKPREICTLVFMELSLKIILALSVGLLLVLTLAALFGDTMIPIGEDLRELYDTFGFNVEGFAFSRKTSVFVQPLVLIAGVSLVSMVYPVLRVLQFAPVEALRKV
jgi:ABC-type lipoprotein release transport system permease subunit